MCSGRSHLGKLAVGPAHHRRPARRCTAGVRGGIIHAVTGVEGVVEVDRVRIRRAGNRYFADLSVALPRVVTFQRSEQIVGSVHLGRAEASPERRCHGPLSGRPQLDESIFDRIRAVATRHNVNVHDVSVQDLEGKLHVEQHLELNENFELKEAHDRVTQLESEFEWKFQKWIAS